MPPKPIADLKLKSS